MPVAKERKSWSLTGVGTRPHLGPAFLKLPTNSRFLASTLIVRHLMDTKGLRQVDLLDVFGTASVVSEVLSGKRELSKAHIAKLSDRFHVSPALFF